MIKSSQEVKSSKYSNKENNPVYQKRLAEKRLKRQCKELLGYSKYKTVSGLLRAVQSGRISIEDLIKSKEEHEFNFKKHRVQCWIKSSYLSGLNKFGFETVEQATEWLESVK